MIVKNGDGWTATLTEVGEFPSIPDSDYKKPHPIHQIALEQQMVLRSQNPAILVGLSSKEAWLDSTERAVFAPVKITAKVKGCRTYHMYEDMIPISIRGDSPPDWRWIGLEYFAMLAQGRDRNVPVPGQAFHMSMEHPWYQAEISTPPAIDVPCTLPRWVLYARAVSTSFLKWKEVKLPGEFFWRSKYELHRYGAPHLREYIFDPDPVFEFEHPATEFFFPDVRTRMYQHAFFYRDNRGPWKKLRDFTYSSF